MRFLIFNVAVAGALIYLVSGGNLPLGELVQEFAGEEEVVAKSAPSVNVDPMNESIRKAVSEAMEKMRRQVSVPDDKPAAKPRVMLDPQVSKIPARKKTETAAAKGIVGEPLPPVAKARMITPDPGHVINPAIAQPLAARPDVPEVVKPTTKEESIAASIEVASRIDRKTAKLPDEVARRRAEVLGEVSSPHHSETNAGRIASEPKIKLKEGMTLMTPLDRLKELQALTDELEFMYLERRGG